MPVFTSYSLVNKKEYFVINAVAFINNRWLAFISEVLLHMDHHLQIKLKDRSKGSPPVSNIRKRSDTAIVFILHVL